MAEEFGKVLLFGRTESARSAVANWLVGEKLQDSLSDTSNTCQTCVGRGWTVVDTMGFGEPLDTTIPDEFARKIVIEFLQEVKGRYSLFIFFVDMYDGSPEMKVMWSTFLTIFPDDEKRFLVVVLTDQALTDMLQREGDRRIEMDFPECSQFLYVHFPTNVRMEELERLENQMKRMCLANPCVEPDIFKMEDDEEMAVRILHQGWSYMAKRRPFLPYWTMPEGYALANRGDGFISTNKFRPKMKFGFIPRMKFGCWTSRVEENQPSPRRALEENALTIREKMQSLGKKVKVYHRQCQHLIQRSSRAAEEIHALLRRNEINWERDSFAPLTFALWSFVCSMEAGMKLLHLCVGDSTLKEVALSLSSPAPFRHSLSAFGLVVQELEWALDAFHFLIETPEAGRARKTPFVWQFWLSIFSWCEERCRLVYNENGDDPDLCLAADNDRHTHDRQAFTSTLERLKPSASELFMSVVRNRLQGDCSFSDSNSKAPSCFWIPGKLLQYQIIDHIGGGSYKTVHKCKWLEMEVAIATFHEGGRESMELEAGLLARVQHPNVVSFIGYSFDEEKQRGFLVTELMETNLHSLINKSRSEISYPFTIPQAIHILLQIVEAMIHVHECGVMHRDLKAQNCLVNRKDININADSLYYTVKLIDFGESKLGSGLNTRNRGTRAWMAPEVHGRGEEETKLYTGAVDVYSFGMTCYEILTGRQPFGNIRGSQLTELVSAGRRPEIPMNCPEELVELMTKCWAHSPEDRPTFKDVRLELWNCRLRYTIWDRVQGEADSSDFSIPVQSVFAISR